jgi:hypothetical protein
MASKTHKQGNLISRSTGSSRIKEITFEKWVEPLITDFINYRTNLFRSKYINKDAHVVVLSNQVLNSLDENGEKVIEDGVNAPQVRAFAKHWISRRQPNKMKSDYAREIHNLNVANSSNHFFHYVVFTNWAASQNLFKEMKDAGLVRKGFGTQRGHDTAAVRLHADSALSKMQETEGSGDDFSTAERRKKNVAHKAALDLRKELQNLSDRLTPTLTFGSRVKINAETKGIQGVQHLVILTPETRASNQGAKQKLEARHRKDIERIVNKFIKRYGGLTVNIKGSNSPMKEVNEVVTDMLLGKKRKAYNRSYNKKVKTKRQTVKLPRVKVSSPPPLRTKAGKFTSAMNIQSILDQRIKQQVQDNMGEGGALVNRTGRFASSVTVEKVMQSRQGVLTAFYTYMKAPYQTFERGFAQGSFRRDPRKLISRSIREIAMETLNHKLPIRTRRV